MKKLTLLCIAAITCLSLSACGSQTTKKSDSSSKSSSSKIVKKHRKSNKQYKSVNSSSSSSQQTQVQSSATPVKQANQSNAHNSYQVPNNQMSQNNAPTSEDQARAMLGGANGDLQATRTGNGWTFSGDGYTATVNDDGTISHN